METRVNEVDHKALRRSKWRRGIIRGALITTLVLVGYSGMREKSISDRLYQKISLKADTNNDNITDVQEWANVYESLGLAYDIHYSRPKRDLGIKKMKEYLNKE